MAKLIYISFFLILISSCCPCKKAITTSEVKTSDSSDVRVETTIKDSLIYTPVDSAGIKALVKCPDLELIKVKHNNAVVSLSIKNGVAKADCFCDSVGIMQRTTKTVEKQFKQRLKDSKTTKVISVPFYPKWLVILAIIGGISIGYWAFRIYQLFKLK